MQTRCVHHDEHGVQTFAGFANDFGQGIFKTHHTSGAAMQAHLLFNAIAMDGTAFAVRVKLGDQEKRQTFWAGRRIGQPSQDQMHNVVGQVVFATRDENFGAVQRITAIGLGGGFGARQA